MLTTALHVVSYLFAVYLIVATFLYLHVVTHATKEVNERELKEQQEALRRRRQRYKKAA